jgi:hypothetical protein
VFFRRGDKLFFVYGFAKSQRDDIKEDEERRLKKNAKKDFALSDELLAAAVKSGKLVEI